MMLPEHNEAIQRQLRDLNKRTKPVLDEQKWELITRAMAYSYNGAAADYSSSVRAVFGN
ncbi:YolD-like family protein [Paenibacillus chitinolyticus]|uniref:YolD-like family protein n=1 Tax=Paenibacillus chitinolyticus TaxID=79263 RepID=UPI0037C7A3EC